MSQISTIPSLWYSSRVLEAHKLYTNLDQLVHSKTPELWNHRLRTLSSTDYNPPYLQVEFVDYKRAEEEVERCGSEVTAKDTTSLDFSQPLPGTS